MSGRPSRRNSSHQRPGLVIIAAAGLGVAVACLARIGGPPRIGIDSLWLHQHLNEVRVLLASVALVVLASLAMLVLRRRLTAVVVLWLVAVAVSAAFFPDRVETVYRALVWYAR
ncbi:MAG: hypothetical protein IH983_14900 [Planctomycetes bacterium]|nr:hypothetical protein [Planctomycetota bacterium]